MKDNKEIYYKAKLRYDIHGVIHKQEDTYSLCVPVELNLKDIKNYVKDLYGNDAQYYDALKKNRNHSGKYIEIRKCHCEEDLFDKKTMEEISVDEAYTIVYEMAELFGIGEEWWWRYTFMMQ